VRILAKIKANGVERLKTDSELMADTGWTRSHLMNVYQAASWDHVKVGDMNLFLKVCGLSPDSQRRSMWTLQRAYRSPSGLRSLRHMRPSGPLWMKRQANALIEMIERVLRNEYV